LPGTFVVGAIRVQPLAKVSQMWNLKAFRIHTRTSVPFPYDPYRRPLYCVSHWLCAHLPHPFGRRANPARQPPESRYEKEWWEIDSLAAEGLPRPALRKVDALQARARREQNAPGQINDFASTLSWIKMPASIRKKRGFSGNDYFSTLETE
jgi:hypothetical protein